MVHDGAYGRWSVDDKDIAEVLAYRGGITCTALCTALVALSATTDVVNLPAAATDAACGIGAASFGVSLVLVHMYVGFIKRAIQVRCALSFLGPLPLAQPELSVAL